MEKELVGFTAGNFDLLHPGYIYTFEEAKRHCDSINLTWLKKNSPNPLLHVIFDELHQTILNYTKNY